MSRFVVTAFPYVTVYGKIEIPDTIRAENRADYVREHWKDISFGEPDFDYSGTDFDLDLEE